MAKISKKAAKKPKAVKLKKKPVLHKAQIARLEKKLKKISAHIRKCRGDLQGIFRLKQIKHQLGGK